MNRKKLFRRIAVLGCAAQLMIPSAAGASNSSKVSENVTAVVNGVRVHGEATHYHNGKLFVDAAGYAELLGMAYSFNKNSGVFTINGQKLRVKMHKNKPAVHIRAMAHATGAENVLWQHKQAYVLDVPDGVVGLEGTQDVMMPGLVPGMGQHWADPKDMPYGPIYGIEKGKLVFIEQMIPQADFASGKNHVNIPGMKGKPSPAVQHTDIEFVPNGHAGFEIPHYDIHHYFVAHAEHLTFKHRPMPE